MEKLASLYGVEDEDGLPDFDLLEVMELGKDKRADFLKEKLAACPKGTCARTHARTHKRLPECRRPWTAASRHVATLPAPTSTDAKPAVEELLKKVDELNLEI